MRIPFSFAVALSVASCSGVPADRAAIEANAARIEPMVIADCSARGALSVAGSAASLLSPLAGVAMSAAGRLSDKACFDPAKTARDIAVMEEMAKNLRDQRR